MRYRRGLGRQDRCFDVVIFGAQAETASQYLTKDRRVAVDGRLDWQESTDDRGTHRQNVRIIAERVSA